MQHVEIQTAQNVALHYPIAGLGDRILAQILDGLILFAYLVLTLVVIAAAAGAGLFSDETASVVVFVLLYAPVVFYHLLCEVLLHGQSLGKKARQIRVMRLDGREPSFADYFLRWLLGLVDFTLTSGVAAVVSVLATRHSQRLGDLAAGTTVVSLKKRRDLRETLFVETPATYAPHFPQVDRLADADIALTKDVYNLLIAEGRTARARQAGERLKKGLEQRMGVTTNLPPLELARTVLRDYNALHGVVE